MKLNKNLAVSESGFIFNPGTGDSFSVNPIGAEVLGMLKEDKSPDQIKAVLFEKYEVEKTLLEKDVDDFLTQLKDHNMMQR
ncbi:MAG: PqqD family protein [Bacteroidia bacterium]|nr:PqqD family protein [Bacteroidia bacterium]